MKLQTIGLRIKQARETADITQEALAREIGCTVQHISAIERGIKTPRMETFIAIANAIGASADLLLQDVLENKPDTLACECAAVMAPLPREIQIRIIKALHIFSEEEK